jgi:hypothetical protein
MESARLWEACRAERPTAVGRISFFDPFLRSSALERFLTDPGEAFNNQQLGDPGALDA